MTTNDRQAGPLVSSRMAQSICKKIWRVAMRAKYSPRQSRSASSRVFLLLLSTRASSADHHCDIEAWLRDRGSLRQHKVTLLVYQYSILYQVVQECERGSGTPYLKER
jgi:hypothetical protein